MSISILMMMYVACCLVAHCAYQYSEESMHLRRAKILLSPSLYRISITIMDIKIYCLLSEYA